MCCVKGDVASTVCVPGIPGIKYFCVLVSSVNKCLINIKSLLKLHNYPTRLNKNSEVPEDVLGMCQQVKEYT